METMSDGKIRIVGEKAVNSTHHTPVSRKMALINECALADYFKKTEVDDNALIFAQNVIYVGCTNITNTPHKRTPSIRVIPSTYMPLLRGYRVPKPIEVQGRIGEPVILFKIGTSPRIRAVFYTASKTLITGSIHRYMEGTTYLNKIIASLMESGHLAVLTPEGVLGEQPQQTAYKRGIEFHDGQRMFINLPLPRKTCTMGTDPEFEYLDGHNRPVRAPDMYKTGGHGVGENIEIGIDGAQFSIELRPKPFDNPADVVAYMAGIMQRTKEFDPHAKLSTIGEITPLGGHIHCGVGFNWVPPRDMMYLLDYFLGKRVIDLSGTARGHYRQMGAVRGQAWGFEYRTPPASIFAWPEFARLALKIVKSVTECFINEQVILINAEPGFEDYWNYCNFTPKEYERWLYYIARYREMMDSPGRYQNDVITAWLGGDEMAVLPTSDEMRAAVAQAEEARRAEEERARIASDQRARIRMMAVAEAARRQSEEEMNILHRVTFSDDWEPSIAESFRTRILNMLNLVAPNTNTAINIFGLRESRGAIVYGYSVDGYERIYEGTWSGYGVPYAVRIGRATPDEINAHINAIMTALNMNGPDAEEQ
jgi:hypothetical protein